VTRSQRIGRVREGLERGERDSAARALAAEQRVVEARQRLQELQRYRAEYRASLDGRTAAGIGTVALRDFQAFLGRLDEAIRQQAQIVGRAETERDFERSRWLDAAKQVKAVATVAERWQLEERRETQRHEQREIDERAGARHRESQEPLP
jgi:flagellar FliJ protein